MSSELRSSPWAQACSLPGRYWSQSISPYCSSVGDVVSLMRRTPDLDAELAALPAPRLVVSGEHDLWPVELHRAFAERIGAELLVTAGGHSPCEDSPVELTRALVALADRAA